MRRNLEVRSGDMLKRIGRYFLKRLEKPTPSYEKRIINNMSNLYRQIRPGDVLLVEGRSKLSGIIQLLTKSTWSHAAIYVGDRLHENVDAHVSAACKGWAHPDRRRMLIEADAGNGVTAVALSKYKEYNIRICRPFGIVRTDLDKVLDTVVGNLGRHYDHENLVDLALLALPPFINPFKKHTIQACLGGCTEYKVICSGMIAKAFQTVGYPIVPGLLPASDTQGHMASAPYGSRLVMRHHSQIVPKDFDLSPNFEIVKYNIVGLGRFNYKSIWAGKQEALK